LPPAAKAGDSFRNIPDPGRTTIFRELGLAVTVY
jgi:hypothetical protein